MKCFSPVGVYSQRFSCNPWTVIGIPAAGWPLIGKSGKSSGSQKYSGKTGKSPGLCVNIREIKKME